MCPGHRSLWGYLRTLQAAHQHAHLPPCVLSSPLVTMNAESFLRDRNGEISQAPSSDGQVLPSIWGLECPKLSRMSVFFCVVGVVLLVFQSLDFSILFWFLCCIIFFLVDSCCCCCCCCQLVLSRHLVACVSRLLWCTGQFAVLIWGFFSSLMFWGLRDAVSEEDMRGALCLALLFRCHGELDLWNIDHHLPWKACRLHSLDCGQPGDLVF